jgi:hypothetical protein
VITSRQGFTDAAAGHQAHQHGLRLIVFLMRHGDVLRARLCAVESMPPETATNSGPLISCFARKPRTASAITSEGFTTSGAGLNRRLQSETQTATCPFRRDLSRGSASKLMAHRLP